ncbi:MAG TPA: CHAD domain-containing protein [Chthoniobacterales bacterium]|nr:CHAD domain-containing protein [Chthoniobacterales bacterium]
MAFRFENHETPVDGVKRIASERLEQAIAAAGIKPRPSPDDVHEIRKDLKSLRALLQLARGHLLKATRGQENLVLRDAGRTLSSNRDAAALLEALEKLFGPQKQPKGEALQPAGRQIVDRLRQQIQTEAARSLTQRDLRTVAEMLSSMRTRIPDWVFATGVIQRGSMLLAAGLERTYRLGRQHYRIVDTIGMENATDELWHEIRKQAKALGYQLRLLRKIWPSALHAWIDALDELSDGLGDDHDFALIQQKILQLPFESSDTEEQVNARQALLRAIDRRRQRLKLFSLNRARMIYVEKPARFVQRLSVYWELWRDGGKTSAPRKRTGDGPSHRVPGHRQRQTANGPAFPHGRGTPDAAGHE